MNAGIRSWLGAVISGSPVVTLRLPDNQLRFCIKLKCLLVNFIFAGRLISEPLDGARRAVPPLLLVIIPKAKATGCWFQLFYLTYRYKIDIGLLINYLVTPRRQIDFPNFWSSNYLFKEEKCLLSSLSDS